jgi:glycerol-3-phosphate responsive antiterminator
LGVEKLWTWGTGKKSAVREFTKKLRIVLVFRVFLLDVPNLTKNFGRDDTEKRWF